MKEFIISIQNWISVNATTSNFLTLGFIIVVIVVIVTVFKTLKSLNTTIVIFVFGLIFVGVFLYWVNERNEPAFMTPLIEQVAEFLPTKGDS